MIRHMTKPSRIRDALGIAVLAGTAMLYAMQPAAAPAGDACSTCEDAPAAPALAPAEGTPSPEPVQAAASEAEFALAPQSLRL